VPGPTLFDPMASDEGFGVLQSRGPMSTGEGA
jgi:hypothetical protein